MLKRLNLNTMTNNVHISNNINLIVNKINDQKQNIKVGNIRVNFYSLDKYLTKSWKLILNEYTISNLK